MGLFDQAKDNLLGVGEGLLGIFGGGGEATTRAGAATLMAVDQGASGLAALAQGSIAGMDAQEILRKQAVKEKDRQDLQNVIASSGMDVAGVRAAFMEAISNGQIEEAKHLATVLQMMGSSSGQSAVNLDLTEHPLINSETGETHKYQIGTNPITGEIVSRNDMGVIPVPASVINAGERKTEVRNIDDAMAQRFGYTWGGSAKLEEQDDGTSRVVEMLAENPPEWLPTVEAARFTWDQMNDADWIGLTSADSQASMARGDGFGAKITRFIGGAFTNAAEEQAVAGGMSVVMGIQNALSGKQMTESERTFILGMTLPTLTDTEETAIWKGKNAGRLLDILRSGGRLEAVRDAVAERLDRAPEDVDVEQLEAEAEEMLAAVEANKAGGGGNLDALMGGTGR